MRNLKPKSSRSPTVKKTQTVRKRKMKRGKEDEEIMEQKAQVENGILTQTVTRGKMTDPHTVVEMGMILK